MHDDPPPPHYHAAHPCHFFLQVREAIRHRTMREQPVGLCLRQRDVEVMWDISHLVKKQSCWRVFKFISWGHLLCKAEEEGREKLLFFKFISQRKKKKRLILTEDWLVCHSGFINCPSLFVDPSSQQQGAADYIFVPFTPCQTPPPPHGARWRRKWLISRPHLCPFAPQDLCWTPICRRPPLWWRPRRTGHRRTSAAGLHKQSTKVSIDPSLTFKELSRCNKLALTH